MTPTSHQSDARILIVAFDGLRPDMVTDDIMPNLTRFAREGASFPTSRAVFPSETRVNQASFVSGAWPRRHGIVGNKFIDAVASPDALINSGDEDELRAASEKLDGALIDVPSLGEILAGHGRQLAVVGSGTAGGTRMLHHAAERLGQFRFSLYRPDASTPQNQIGEIIDQFGPIPEARIPSNERLTYATDTYLGYVEPRLRPDVAILWFFEPDLTYHYSGLGTPDSLSALRHADAQLARILDYRDAQPADERLHIVTLSDHGHLATEGAAIDLQARLAEAGFRVGNQFDDGIDVITFCGSAGGVYTKNSDQDLLARVLEWLQGQDWCGPVFTKDGHGGLALADVHLDHARAPDLVFVTRSHDNCNAHGYRGRCPHDWAQLPPAGGIHGGLHPMELSNWLAVQGAAFKPAFVSDLPCGIVDVLPTVLHLLGVPAPESVEGRVLEEALAGRAGPSAEETEIREHAVPHGPDRTFTLTTRRVGAHHYLQQGLSTATAP
ncbi:MAG: alkaline phosphatase family protein [Methyloligellaceae bacterium]